MVGKTTDNKLKIIGLFASNYLVQYHVREMARLLKKSHVTLLPHIKALENDKIIIPKIVGKNKSYTLNLGNILSKNYIFQAELFNLQNYLGKVFLIKIIITGIYSLNIPTTFVLFGSYAKMKFTDESDIDLFCLGEISEDQVGQIKAIGKAYGKVINLKKSTLENFERGLRKKDALIIEILKNHVLLHGTEQFIDALWRYFCEIKT